MNKHIKTYARVLINRLQNPFIIVATLAGVVCVVLYILSARYVFNPRSTIQNSVLQTYKANEVTLDSLDANRDFETNQLQDILRTLPQENMVQNSQENSEFSHENTPAQVNQINTLSPETIQALDTMSGFLIQFDIIEPYDDAPLQTVFQQHSS